MASKNKQIVNMSSEMLVTSGTKYIFSFGRLSPKIKEFKIIIPANIAYHFNVKYCVLMAYSTNTGLIKSGYISQRGQKGLIGNFVSE